MVLCESNIYLSECKNHGFLFKNLLNFLCLIVTVYILNLKIFALLVRLHTKCIFDAVLPTCRVQGFLRLLRCRHGGQRYLAIREIFYLFSFL